MKKTQIKINLSHLRHNVRLLKQHLGPYFFCPVVKANAYGHGLSLIIPCLETENIDALCVSSIEEAVHVRSLLQRPIPILIFTAHYDLEDIQACWDHHLTPVIGQISDLLKFQALHKPLNIHLKFNTGLNCYGFSIKEAEFVKETIAKSPYLHITGIATHLAKSYDAGCPDGCTALQEKAFRKVQKVFGQQNYHYQNSGCLVLQGNIGIGGRPGLAIYGVMPYTYKPVSMDLKPVMSFETQIIQLQNVTKNMSVSYEHKWTAQRPSTIGLIPIGYADILKRNIEGRHIHFLIKGQLVPLIGVIRMNCCLLDLTDIQGDIQIGEKVVIFGKSENKHISIYNLVHKSGLTPYEIFTSIRSNTPRTAIEDFTQKTHSEFKANFASPSP